MEAFKVGVIPEGSDVVVSCIAPPGDFERKYRLGIRTYGYEGTPVLCFDRLSAAVEFLKFEATNMKVGRRVILVGEVPEDTKPCKAVAFINSPQSGSMYREEKASTEDIIAFWRGDRRSGDYYGGAPDGTLAAAWFRPLAEVVVTPPPREWQRSMI